MTWRQILEGLAAFPVAIKELRTLRQVATVSIATLKPGDVVVVETDGMLTQQTRERISDGLHNIWPGRKVVIFDSGLKLRIVSDPYTGNPPPPHEDVGGIAKRGI